MAFGLRNRNVPEEEIKAKVLEAAKILDIEDYLDRKPKAMSGGQRQRVALGSKGKLRIDVTWQPEDTAEGTLVHSEISAWAEQEQVYRLETAVYLKNAEQ